MFRCFGIKLIHPEAVAASQDVDLRKRNRRHDRTPSSAYRTIAAPEILTQNYRADLCQRLIYLCLHSVTARQTLARWHYVSSDWRDWNAARAAATKAVNIKAVNNALQTC